MKLKKVLSMAGTVAVFIVGYLAFEHWKISTDVILGLMIALMWMRYETRIETLSNHLAAVELSLEEKFPDEFCYSNPDMQRNF